MGITKKSIDLYKVRSDNNQFSWADISIDQEVIEDGDRARNPFRISISSDYGNWAFYWSHPGDCWRSFLLEINIGYAARKFGEDNWFDEESTRETLHRDIIQERRLGLGDKDSARAAWNSVNSVIDEYPGKDLICENLINSDWSKFWGDHWIDWLDMKTGIDPSFKMFWNGPFQSFLLQIKEELKNKTSEVYFNSKIPEFLLEMSKQINTQSNRFTSDPIFFVCYDNPYVTAEGYEDYIEYAVADGDDQVLFSTEDGSRYDNDHAIKWLLENEPEFCCTWAKENDTDFYDMDFSYEFLQGSFDDVSSIEAFHMTKKMEVVKACLTESDANAFIARKQHDYRKLYTYANSMVFCPQMIELREWISSLSSE